MRSFEPSLGHFLKNMGFLKIVIFPHKYQCFQGLGLPKMVPKFNKKLMQNLEGWKHRAKGTWQQLFSQTSVFLVDFGVPFGVQNGAQNGLKTDLGSVRVARGSQRLSRGRFWKDFGPFWELFWDEFLKVFGHISMLGLIVLKVFALTFWPRLWEISLCCWHPLEYDLGEVLYVVCHDFAHAHRCCNISF